MSTPRFSTLEELEEALEEVFSGGFSIETDNNGQIIIYTGLIQEDGELVEYEDDEEEDDEEEELDEDLEPLEDDDEDDE